MSNQISLIKKILNYLQKRYENIESNNEIIDLQKLDLLTPPMVLAQINRIWDNYWYLNINHGGGGANTMSLQI